MKIVIAGAGEVGTHLAKLLSNEDQDITLIDADSNKLMTLDANYNLLTIEGSPTSFSVISDAHVDDCDLFIAVTPNEASNIIACSIAKSLGARRTVARIDNYEYMQSDKSSFFSRQGIDALIYPEYLAAQEIISALRRSWARNWFELHDGLLIVIGAKIREGAQLCGMQLKDLSRLGQYFHVSAIKRNHETILPRGDDFILNNDIIYFTTTRDHVDELRKVCGKRANDIRRVLIMGGSRIAVRLVALAGDQFRFKIIDNNMERCSYLSERLRDARIVYGDARDMDTLHDEGIEDMDAFIALTGSSETNILTCLTAKEAGVGKTVAEVENLQFFSEAENLNIGTIINKKLLASGKIFQMLLDADIESSKFMALADADVAEIEVRPGSKITRGPVKSLSLPHDMTIAGVIRDGRGELVNGNTEFHAGDHVVVICLSGSIHKIERLFV